MNYDVIHQAVEIILGDAPDSGSLSGGLFILGKSRLNGENLNDTAKRIVDSLSEVVENGGKGSGNFGHAGRPGKVGGSGGSGPSVKVSDSSDTISAHGHTFSEIPVSRGQKIMIDDEEYTAENIPLSFASWAKYQFIKSKSFVEGTYTDSDYLEIPGDSFEKEVKEIKSSYTPSSEVTNALMQWTSHDNALPLKDMLKNKESPFYQEVQDLIKANRKFLKAKSNGITLYRGITEDDEWQDSGRGFESWTSDIETARKFAGEDGTVLRSNVNVSNILFSPNQGFGSWGESEYIVEA